MFVELAGVLHCKKKKMQVSSKFVLGCLYSVKVCFEDVLNSRMS